MVMGVAKLKEFDDEQSVSRAVKTNIEKTLLTDAELSSSFFYILTPYDYLPGVLSILNHLSYGFDTLSSLCPEATLHRGIYEDNKDSLRLFTLVSGLSVSDKRLNQLNTKGN